MALGNLLGIVIYVIGFLLIYPNAPAHPPLTTILLHVLTVAVFLSQRSYAWLVARQWAEEDDDASETRASPFDFWAEWLERPLVPRLLIGGNLILAAAAGASLYGYLEYLDQFQNVIPDYRLSLDITPETRFLVGFDCYNWALATANVLFNALVMAGGWRVVHSWLLLLGLLVVGSGALAYTLAADSGRDDQPGPGRVVRSAPDQAVRPKFETVTLSDGRNFQVAPPPGYIRVTADNPAVAAYLEKFISRYGAASRVRLLTVYVESERRYKEIVKNLERPRCDYHCASGLAWLYEIVSDSRHVNLTGQAFSLDSYGNTMFFSTPEGFSAVDHRLIGGLVWSGLYVGSISNYGIRGEINEQYRQQCLDHSRQWLETLAKANPEPNQP